VDVTDLGAKEPPFLGDERRELVDRLLAEFDQLSGSGPPRWWSLEGHSGWGKTRIVQEFYRRLATERQPGAQYWPPSLIPVVPLAKRVGLATSMRKRVYPEQVVREPDAVPTWFWWGIACAVRSGTPVQALADDLTQFLQHEVGLQRRWRALASPAARLGARLSSKKGELVDTAVGEGLGVAASLASVAVPGLGVLVLAAKWSVQGLRDNRLAAGTPVVDATGGGRADLVDELAPALERLAAAGLPIVITIEDLHLADESLVELLARLLAAQGARVLVISTAWRGLLDEEHRPANRLLKRVAPERVFRVLAEDDLPDLGLSERQEIVIATLPGVSAWNASLLAASYTNPWALQLACNVGWVRRATRDLTAEEVARLPRDVEGLFTQLWQELPEDTRTMLMVAALSTPAGISDSMGFGDARWESSLLAAVSGTEAWGRASTGDLADALGQSSDAYAWIRVVDEWLRRFHDPGQNDVAVGHARIEYDGSERRLMYEAMARRMSTGIAESPTQQLHQARLLVALASEGFLAWDQTTIAGAVTLCASLLAAPDVDSRRHVIMIAENVLRSTSTQPSMQGSLLTLRGQYGSALAEAGKRAEAITEFEALLADQVRLLGADAPETLTTRNSLTWWLGRSGRVEEAIKAFEQLLADRTRVLGPDDPNTLATRYNLAALLTKSGREGQAIAAFDQLLADQRRLLGPDDPAILNARQMSARLPARLGRVGESIAAFDQLLADQRRVLGPDAPQVLSTREDLAWWLGRSGRVNEAIAMLEQVLADRIRVLGADAPSTMSTRQSLGSCLEKSGNVKQAVSVFEQLLADQRRVLGPDDPFSFRTRHRLAKALGQSGRVNAAITAIEQLLADQRRILGVDDLDNLDARHRLAWFLGLAGRVDVAITVFEQVLADRTRVLGPDNPATLETRGGLAWWLGRSGRVDQAITLYEQLLADQERVLEPDNPQILTTRNSLAWWLGRSGQIDEALAMLEQVLADRIRALGADAPQTLTTRHNQAELLAESGRQDEAITALEQVLADRIRVLGADAPQTLTTRSSLAWSVGKSGRVDEAVTAFERVLDDQRTVLDPDAPATLTTRHRLAWCLRESGREEEALAMVKQVLADCIRVLGPDALGTRAVRQSVAEYEQCAD